MTLVQSIAELVAQQAETRSQDTAFIDGDRSYSYGEFAAMCAKTAAWLAAQGVQRGDKVAVWLVNRMEWLAMYGGLSQLGATLMTVNTRYRAHELEYILQQSQARLLVLEPNFRKIDFQAVLAEANPACAGHIERVAVVNAAGELPDSILGKPTVAFDLDALPDASVPAQGQADDLSILFTTSGTTSVPKLVMHTQRTVAVHCQRVAQAYGFAEEGARLLATLPFCGVFGFNALFSAFAAGKPVVIMETFDGPQAAELIVRHGITHIFGSDELFRRIIEHGVGDHPFPTLRVCGFASFHPGVEAFGQAAWDRHIPLYGLYGSSEVQALFSLHRTGHPMSERLRGGGLPAHAGAEIRIRDVDTGEILPVGRSGAIEIRSDTNFVGYLNNREATAKAVDADGYFATGDVGYLREDGSFVFETRQGDAIRLAGYLVSPVEVEDVLKEQPGVADAQVVGIEIDNQMRCAAFVIMQAGSDFDEAVLRSGTSRTLAAFKVPARIWPMDEFPTTQSSNGVKIQRAKLRDMAMKRLEATA